jgi:predicted P-loop ATPase
MTAPQRKPKVVAAIQYLKTLYDFRLNKVSNNIEFRRKGINEIKILEDFALNTMLNQLAEKFIDMSGERLYKLIKSSYIDIYDPFEYYFNKLKGWDEKTDFIGQLALTVKTTNDEIWKKYLPKWIVAMVAGVLDDDVINQEMLVFSGKQGIGKTTWILKLVPDVLKNYKYSGIINLNNKDSYPYLADCILINLDELESFSGKQIGYLKHTITKDSVKYRPPYERLRNNFPRRATFAASINSNEFLHDLSGSRRFLCFEALEIDYQHKIDMEGVYAQALHLWKSGFKYWFSNKEIDEINVINEKYRIKTFEEVLLFEKFESCNENEATHKLTATELLTILHEGNKNNITDKSLQQLGKVLSYHKFNHGKRRKGKVYFLKAKEASLMVYQP